MMNTKYSITSIDLTQVTFRLIVEQDLPALEWDGEYLHFRRLYREIFKSAELGKALMWCVDSIGDGLIGQVFVQFQSARLELANGINRAYIYGFRVKPAFRNLGIGGRLLNTVEMDLIQRNYEWATLNVAKDNPSALRFYIRNGYHKVASEPGYWTYQDDQGKILEVHEPAWRMQKHLRN